MTLPEIIAALEAADGPSRELDAGIALAAGWERKRLGLGHWFWAKGNARHDSPPQFTASLDAALTLVPEGGGWIAGANHEHHATVSTYPLGAESRPLHYAARGSNAAIALCIAALKARAKDVT